MKLPVSAELPTRHCLVCEGDLHTVYVRRRFVDVLSEDKKVGFGRSLNLPIAEWEVEAPPETLTRNQRY